MMQDATFDTSFWGNAYRAGLLPAVRSQFVLHYTSTVAEELPDSNPGGREFRRLVEDGAVLHDEPVALHLSEFGAGERSAISLIIEHPTWVLLIDDYRPFLEALKRELNAVSTPMFIVMQYRDGILRADEALSNLGRLAELKTVSPHLFATALAKLSDQTETSRKR